MNSRGDSKVVADVQEKTDPDMVQRVLDIIPAILECNVLFGDDPTLVSSRWSLIRRSLIETGTPACLDLLKDIDAARWIVKGNTGNSHAYCQQQEQLEDNDSECSERIPALINDSENSQNFVWLRTLHTSPKDVPEAVSSTKWPIITSKAYCGVESSLKTAQNVKKERKNNTNRHRNDDKCLPDDSMI